MSKKLTQVLEYLLAGKEDKAKALLHQVFIEKARAIHEEIMSADDAAEDDIIGGDEGDDWKDDITGKHDKRLKGLSDEIDAEETMAEDDDDFSGLDGDTDDFGGDDVDVEDGEDNFGDDEGSEDNFDADGEFGDDDIESDGEEASGEFGDIENSIGDLESALEELKAEFDRLESGESGDDDGADLGDDEGSDDNLGSEDDIEADDDADFGDDDSSDDIGVGDEDDAESANDDDEGSEDDVDESWLDEDWDELAEAIELEKVKVEMSGEVGSGSFQPADANAKAKSPIATSQTARFGSSPIKIDDKKHSGYSKETPPTSKDMGLSNRRKTSTTGNSKVPAGRNSSALINKTGSEFGADTVGKNSILSKSPRK